MRRRTTFLRVSLASAIFLGLQAGLCAGACAVGAIETSEAVASAPGDCHSETEPDHAASDGLRSDSTSFELCCSALPTTGADHPAPISSAPLLAVEMSRGIRVPTRRATASWALAQQRALPPADILLLKSTLLL